MICCFSHSIIVQSICPFSSLFSPFLPFKPFKPVRQTGQTNGRNNTTDLGEVTLCLSAGLDLRGKESTWLRPQRGRTAADSRKLIQKSKTDRTDGRMICCFSHSIIVQSICPFSSLFSPLSPLSPSKTDATEERRKRESRKDAGTPAPYELRMVSPS